MSNKTDFCCDSLPNAIELPRRGEGEKIFSPLCALLTGHVKIGILIPTVDWRGNILFQFSRDFITVLFAFSWCRQ